MSFTDYHYYFAYLKFFVGILFIVFGIVVYYYKRNNLPFILLTTLCGLISILSGFLIFFACYQNTIIHIFPILFSILGAFVPMLLFHFSLSFLYTPQWFNKKLTALIYLPSIYFVYNSIFEKYYSNIYPLNGDVLMDSTPEYTVYLIYTGLCFVLTVIMLIIKYKGSTGLRKNQLKSIIIGFAIGGILLSVGNGLEIYKIHIYSSEIGYVVLLFSMSYAILKFRAFEINMFILNAISWIVIRTIILVPILIIVINYKIIYKSQNEILGLIILIYVLMAYEIIIPYFDNLLNRDKKYFSDLLLNSIKKINCSTSIDEIQKKCLSILSESLTVDETILLISNGNQLVGQYNQQEIIIEIQDLLKYINVSEEIIIDSPKIDLTKVINNPVLFNIKILSIIKNDGLMSAILILGEMRNSKLFKSKHIQFIKGLSLNLGNIIKNNLLIHSSETSLREQKKQFELKTNLFINLAHETKTPLTIIQNDLTDYINKYGVSQEIIRIKSNIDQLLSVMINFMDSEKLLRGQMEYDNHQVLDLSNYVTNKVNQYTNMAKKRGLELINNISPHIYIQADPYAVDRILNNLLDNAIKYTNEGYIKIELLLSDSNVTFSIQDSGIGISKDVLGHIFEAYYQITHKKRNIQGIGMGLNIVSQIIKTLGWDISVQSELNHGTKFIVNMPKYTMILGDIIENNVTLSKPIESFTPKMPEILPPDRSRSTILIVEDNQALLVSLIEHIQLHYNVISAANGARALEIMKNAVYTKPDLILSDIMMDEMDGYQLFDKIKNNSDWTDIPFIFLTAKSTINEMLDGLSRGAVDYINKPFDMGLLLAKIRALIEFNQIRKQLFNQEKYAAIGRLTAGINHQLLNPLSIVRGRLDKLIEKNNNGENLKEFNSMTDGLNRIENTIKTMRALLYENESTEDVINLNELIENLIWGYQSQTQNINKKFKNEIDKGIRIKSNYSSLKNIAMNIISNAVDATDNNGIIIIRAEGDSYKFRLTIEDNGIGIEEKNIQKLFDINYTTKPIGEGTGLGLYIAKELADRCGIEIQVESRPGKTIFTLIHK